jgi:transcription initiation factor TFIIB
MSKQNVMARDILQCRDCRQATQILVDYSQGVVICRACGLVLETSCIDDSQEWRNFSDSTGDAKSDRNRVGAISSDGLIEHASGTAIAAGASRLSRIHFLAVGGDSGDRTLTKAHGVLRDVMRALGLPDNIYGRCCEILKFLDSADQLRNRTSYPWVLAIVYLACRQERAGRTISELVRAQPTVKEAEVARNYWKLDKLLAGTKVRDTGSTGLVISDNSIVRYCSRLGILAAEKASEHVAMQASRFGLTGGKSPNVIAAAAVFTIAHLLDLPNKPTLEAVAEVSQIRLPSLKQAYQSLRQPIDRLLPSDMMVQFSDALHRLP